MMHSYVAIVLYVPLHVRYVGWRDISSIKDNDEQEDEAIVWSDAARDRKEAEAHQFAREEEGIDREGSSCLRVRVALVASQGDEGRPLLNYML